MFGRYHPAVYIRWSLLLLMYKLYKYLFFVTFILQQYHFQSIRCTAASHSKSHNNNNNIVSHQNPINKNKHHHHHNNNDSSRTRGTTTETDCYPHHNIIHNDNHWLHNLASQNPQPTFLGNTVQKLYQMLTKTNSNDFMTDDDDNDNDDVSDEDRSRSSSSSNSGNNDDNNHKNKIYDTLSTTSTTTLIPSLFNYFVKGLVGNVSSPIQQLKTSTNSNNDTTTTTNTTTAWDYVESVRSHLPVDVVRTQQQCVSSSAFTSTTTTTTNQLDHWIGSIVKKLRYVVGIQCLITVIRSSNITSEIASQFLSPDSLDAVNMIRTMLATIQSHHGVVVDVFARYKRSDILIAIYALSRLQRSAHYYKWNVLESNKKQRTTTTTTTTASTNFTKTTNEQQQQSPPQYQHEPHYYQHQYNNHIVSQEPYLVQDLAHYAIYANAAYGWKMDFAFRQRVHLGGNHQTLVRRTGIQSNDIIQAQWESRTHRPAYFCVRDKPRQAIVIAIRGTWTVHDLLTDLCCTQTEVHIPTDNNNNNRKEKDRNNKEGDFVDNDNVAKKEKRSEQSTPGSDDDENNDTEQAHKVAGHHGMLTAARLVQEDIEPLLKLELENSCKNYTLVIVGHSLGGGVAALLGTLLQRTFREHQINVYTYGTPCVSPIETKNPSNGGPNVISVISENDPFRCLSLGHIADVSIALSALCDNPHLRNQILLRTNSLPSDMEYSDLQWSHETMNQLRTRMNSDKLYPPGRIMLLTERKRNLIHSQLGFISGRRHSYEYSIKEVPTEFFEDFVISPGMLDLSRHLPSFYETCLAKLAKLTNFYIT